MPLLDAESFRPLVPLPIAVPVAFAQLSPCTVAKAQPAVSLQLLAVWKVSASAFRVTAAVVVMIGSVLSFPDFGWIEAAQLLVGVSCLRMIARFVESEQFASPFADGTLLAVGGLWVAVIAVGNTFFDGAEARSQIIIVLGCMALFLAGMIIRWNEGPRWYEHDYAA